MIPGIVAGYPASASAAHRYWGLRLNSNNGQSFVMIHRIEFADVPAASRLNTNSAQAIVSPWLGVFGNSRDFAWGSYNMPPDPGYGGTDRWMENASSMPFEQGYDFAAPVAIVEVRIRSIGAAGHGAYGIRDFDILYSDDGTTWTTALAVTGQTWVDENDIKTYTLP